MTELHAESKKAIEEIRQKAGAHAKVIFVSGKFSIVHPGHLRLLRFAAECGDFLAIGVYADGQTEDALLLPEALRLEGIQATSWVDYAFVLRDAPEEFIAVLKPAVVVKGKEHENQFNAEMAAVNAYRGKLLFSSGDVSFSSVDLLSDEFRRLNSSTIIKPQDFLKRHNFNFLDLKKALQKIQQLKVLVIGDTILDEYISCDPVGMSQEDPTIVVTPIMREKFVGAAGIVAAHAHGLGADVHFFTVTGQGATGEYVVERLEQYGVTIHAFKDDSRPTTVKQRFRANGKTLLRVNHLRNHTISVEIQKEILGDVVSVLDQGIQLVIFSDFNYGCLPQALVDQIIANCRQRDIMMVADSQSSSQFGDVSRFTGMALLTPTEREARLAVRDFDSGLVVLAEALRRNSRAKNIIITLGKEGVLIHAETSEHNKWLNDRLPAMNIAPKDIAGAGDSLLTVSAIMMAVGCDIWQSTYMSSLAAAYQVGKLGNTPLSVKDLEAEIQDRRMKTP
jgi:rfaE bifunctional protein kinase chain/domain